MKIQIVNEVNKVFTLPQQNAFSAFAFQVYDLLTLSSIMKDFVVEALRSIAELITYGDQHDPAFFEFFMEKQVMGEFVRILKISRSVTVSLQLLQTMSIMIQNLKSEHAIYYMFSNEHINYLITYTFDFRNEELLSYYISFLRAISGKLNKNTISLLVKTRNDEVVSFPLYVEAIRYAFQEENMVRTAIRALTLNVYHVGDESVNRYVTTTPHAAYFSNLVTFFRKQCINLNGLVSDASKNPGPESTSSILVAVDEIEDNLTILVMLFLLGFLMLGENLFYGCGMRKKRGFGAGGVLGHWGEKQISAVTSLYLLCCILRIVKIKDLANTVAASLFCPLEAFIKISETKLNGYISGHGFTHEREQSDSDNLDTKVESGSLRVTTSNLPGSSQSHQEDVALQRSCSGSSLALREVLLSYVNNGDDMLVLGSLSVIATLLQTKELDESMLDALGILPQRKQHKKLLLVSVVMMAISINF
ncbi:Protein CLEC16A-like [Vitis vinifera]|uniref:Protein CLEC16A-like n=1 Tax=Vitis vinifera TaxID=29760 RepID=A0A438JFT3_VITVI|nr:Protein CLEC16A-like [Vitis vinifera]